MANRKSIIFPFRSKLLKAKNPYERTDFVNRVAVVYWSGTGNTEKMAELVAEGVVAAGGRADIFTAAEFTKEMVQNYKALAFGCPSMGVEELEDTEFEPMFSSVKEFLKGKVIGLFGSYDWGDGEWMRNRVADCEDYGLTLINDGVIANNEPDDEAAENCRALGAALAKA